MEKFISKNFLLETDYARELFYEYGQSLPILDYHCHLPPTEVAENRQFENLTKLWIDGDHYKWRAMRQLGIKEQLITGNASDENKFKAWAETIPYTARNPLFHWTHLELKRYFGIDELLTPKTASAIYEQVNVMLEQPAYTAQGLLASRNVELVCTTDDPLDDLAAHKQHNSTNPQSMMLPTFRPDGVISIEKIEFTDYLSALSETTSILIKDWESLKAAIRNRVEYFHCHGCRLSDHGLPHAYGMSFTQSQVAGILKDKLAGENVGRKEEHVYKSAIMHFLGTCYAEKGWTMQLHLGPLRDTNKAMLEQIGIDAGVDSIGDYQQAEALAKFLNRLNELGQLPKTVLYNSNPKDNDVFATMAGNFTEEGIRGKVQFGAAWWFLDQKDGISKQIESLSNMGLLATSIGMLTDSRSFLSFPRHEYYRRVLCNILGNDIQRGELPKDIKWIGQLVQDICYNNAKNYFNFPEAVATNSLKAV